MKLTLAIKGTTMNRGAKQKAVFYTAKLSDEDILLVFQSNEEFLTRAQIAERLSRSKSPELCGRIEAMVERRLLLRRIDSYSNGRQMFWYRRL